MKEYIKNSTNIHPLGYFFYLNSSLPSWFVILEVKKSE